MGHGARRAHARPRASTASRSWRSDGGALVRVGGGAHVGRRRARRCRHAGLGHQLRRHRVGRRRRAHPRRRHRLDGAGLGARRRPARRGAARHGGGRSGRGVRDRPSRAVLGAPRRRGQLRRRDALRLPRPRAARVVVWPSSPCQGDARPVLRALRDALREAPRELTVTYMDVPAMDPSAPAGATITACWAGDDAGAPRAALAPLLALDGVAETRARRARRIPRSCWSSRVRPRAADARLHRRQHAAARARTTALIDAPRRVPRGQPGVGALPALARRRVRRRRRRRRRPFPARGRRGSRWRARFDIPGLVDDERRGAASRRSGTRSRRGAPGSTATSRPTTDRAFASRIYAPETMARLAAVKREWDPQNLFSRNHNVAPA